MLKRVTDLTSAPVVGRRYLVPVVTFPWLTDDWRPWPVLLPRHDDAEFLDFPWPHYHVDPRFICSRYFKRAGLRMLFATPVGGRRFWSRTAKWVTGEEPVTPTPPAHEWKVRQCLRTMPAYPFASTKPIVAIQAAYAGARCRKFSGGWACPHRGVPLGSIAPDDNGCITCPAHGLRVNAATGVVCAPTKDLVMQPSLPGVR